MGVRSHGLRTWIGWGVILAGALARGDEAKVEGDLKAMQGEWVSKDDQMGESTWVFKGDKLTIKTPSRGYDITVTLDPKAKPEKAIDMQVSEASPNAKGVKALGIYKLDGAKALTICFGGPSGERPKDFQADMMQSFAFELRRK